MTARKTAPVVRSKHRSSLDRGGRAAFYSAAAQEDNLGDVVIRRIVLRWITQQSDDVHVFRGGMSDSYIAAINVPDRATIHKSSPSFSRAWLVACGRRRAGLVYAPGPRTAVPGIASTRSALSMVLMTGLTRASNGTVIAVGGAIRGKPSAAMLVHGLNASMCTDYSVRDEVSRDLLRNRPRSIPDVAFAGADPADAVPADPVMAISLRSDRKFDIEDIRRLVIGASAAGIKPVIVTQVRRDQPQHERLSADLGIELCGWTGQSHSEQLDRIDEIYRRSAVVYSNRLHACVFGARNAATIIAPRTGGSGKVHDTFRSVYPCLTKTPNDLELFLDFTSAQYLSDRANLAGRARSAAEVLDREQSTFRIRLGDQETQSLVPRMQSESVPPLLRPNSGHA